MQFGTEGSVLSVLIRSFLRLGPYNEVGSQLWKGRMLMARPKSGFRDVRVSVGEETNRMILELCEKRGIGMAELVRMCVYEFYQMELDREAERIRLVNESEMRKYEAIVEMGKMKYGQR